MATFALATLTHVVAAQQQRAPCVNLPHRQMLAAVSHPGDGGAVGTLSNGDFEAGASVWHSASLAGFKGIYSNTDPDWQRSIASVSPASGQHAVWFRSCSGAPESANVHQRIAIPADARVLTFSELIISRESKLAGVCPKNDVASVYIDGAEARSTALCETLDGDGNPTQLGWQARSIDIAQFAGRTVTLRFEFSADEQDGSNWLIDDVAIAAQ